MKILDQVNHGGWSSATGDKIYSWLAAHEGKDMTIEIKQVENIRSIKQNNAMWKFCENIAQLFNDQSIPCSHNVGDKKIPVMPDKNYVMETLWRPLMKAMTKKESTTQMTTVECIQIGDYICNFLRNDFGIIAIFPSEEEITKQELYGKIII